VLEVNYGSRLNDGAAVVVAVFTVVVVFVVAAIVDRFLLDGSCFGWS